MDHSSLHRGVWAFRRFSCAARQSLSHNQRVLGEPWVSRESLHAQ